MPFFASFPLPLPAPSWRPTAALLVMIPKNRRSTSSRPESRRPTQFPPTPFIRRIPESAPCVSKSKPEMDSHADPFDSLRKQLPAWSRTGKILRQHLQLSIANSGVLELKSTHHRLPHRPMNSRVGLKVCIGYGPNLPAPKQPGTF